MEIARLLVTFPFICNVLPFRVTAPELAPSAESLVMISVPASLRKTPPGETVARQQRQRAVLDLTREVTPLIPPAPAMLYGSVLFTSTGNA